MWAIAITGGVGCGKSEILRYLQEEYGCRVILTDECAKEMERKGGALYEPVCRLLTEHGGTHFLGEDGEIDKPAMAAMIFSDSLLLEEINALVHPVVNAYVKGEVERERERGALEFLILESALMIENNYRSFLDEMWYIYCDEEERRRRLALTRGYSQEKITGIMSRQIPETAFREACDVTIDNSGALQDTLARIDAQIRRLRAHEI